MGPEENAGNAGGNGGDAGPPPESGQGSQGGEGDEGLSGDAAGQAQAFPVDTLPEQLRGRSPAEVKLILGQMVSGIQSGAAELQRLREENERLRSGPGIATPAPKKEEPEEALEEMILKDPAKAVAKIVEERYGKRFTELESGAGEGIFAYMRGQDPTFAEYEPDVREALRKSGSPINQQSVHAAFLMTAGQKALEMRKNAESKKTAGAEKGGSGDKEGGKKKEPTLTELEKEVARGMRIDEKKYAEAKKAWNDGSFKINVPTGAAKKEGDK